ncbi:MAG: penicillin-binding protein 2 [Gemmatimonadota bacterium]|nr:penicillin-binding protein 2 [Gemmatimonadota bacterium]HEU4988559.1 penicillin-binding protein 2 [Gemmatimonadaceae bacterium]
MSFHPNEVARRARVALGLIGLAFGVLLAAFFRTQVIRNQQWSLRSEENRLREVPLPAPRGNIFDRTGKIIAENVVGYTVSILPQSLDSLKGTLRRVATLVPLSKGEMDAALRRYNRSPVRPTVILPDASFDEISVLEEHRIDLPNLIIQSSPKRFYPEGGDVAAFVGTIGEVSDSELTLPAYAGYKPGQLVGKQGLEREYETQLRGREGSRFVEVDARGRVVRDVGARADLQPQQGKPLYTNIDLDLQEYIAHVFGDSLTGGAVAIEPRTGAVLALYSAPSWDPNQFVGGVSVAYYDSLLNDTRAPLYNKATQGTYPPGSTWKLATSVIGLEDSLVSMDAHMPQPCTGRYLYGNRYWRCHDLNGHGNLNLAEAIEKSCDIYFYQLGLKIGLSRLIAGGLKLGFFDPSGIDLPEDNAPRFPNRLQYFDQKYGPRGWTQGATVMNMSIGQGENAQTVINMAKFYTALAENGVEATPQIAARPPELHRIFTLSDDQLASLRAALVGVVQAGGTAASAQIQGVVLAGKTGTAQTGIRRNGVELNHAWFAGFAPADDPKIVVVVMIQFGGEGPRAARVASSIIGHYLKSSVTSLVETGG